MPSSLARLGQVVMGTEGARSPAGTDSAEIFYKTRPNRRYLENPRELHLSNKQVCWRSQVGMVMTYSRASRQSFIVQRARRAFLI